MKGRANVLVMIIFMTINLVSYVNCPCVTNEDRLMLPFNSIQEIPNSHLPPSETDSILIEDNFTGGPIGFNTSIWNYTTHGSPPIGWDNEWLVLGIKPLSYSTLKSLINTSYNVVAEFNFTFTKGLCYFGIGWADKLVDSGSDWRSNMRLSQNGVFIDYWDNELCFVSYCNGERVAAPIHNIDLGEEHLYKIEWQSTLVRLVVDNGVSEIISRKIPQVPLPFTITASGHYETTKEDQLRLNYVKVFSLETSASDKPNIDLIWPLNDTQITCYDSVDFDVEDSNGVLFYSWNGQTNETIAAPWDIQVPQDVGTYFLDVYAANEKDEWDLKKYHFDIIQYESSYTCPKMRSNPLIDGVIDSAEKQQTAQLAWKCMNEQRQFEDVKMYIAFPEDSLYVGVESSLQDKWNSRISLLIDGDGDGIWDIDEASFPEDIRITVETPSAYGAYTGIYAPLGHEISNTLFTGLTMASSTNEDGASAEFILDLSSVHANATRGVGIGLLLSRGGYDSYYPAHLGYGIYSNLLIIQSSGLYNPDPMNTLVFMSGGTIITLVAIFGLLHIISARRAVSLERHLDDEELERIKTLLYSYDKISLDRLARLTGLSKTKVLGLTKKLVSRGMVDITVIEFQDDFIRELSELEKKNHNSDIGGELN